MVIIVTAVVMFLFTNLDSTRHHADDWHCYLENHHQHHNDIQHPDPQHLDHDQHHADDVVDIDGYHENHDQHDADEEPHREVEEFLHTHPAISEAQVSKQELALTYSLTDKSICSKGSKKYFKDMCNNFEGFRRSWWEDGRGVGCVDQAEQVKPWASEFEYFSIISLLKLVFHLQHE